jgi:hypothetical protein
MEWSLLQRPKYNQQTGKPFKKLKIKTEGKSIPLHAKEARVEDQVRPRGPFCYFITCP